MKLLESKYYKPTSILGVDDDHIKIFDKNQFLSSSYPFHSILSQCMAVINLDNFDDIFVIHKKKLSDFKQCTDFTSLAFSAKHNKFYEKELCYFHKDFELFLILNTDLSNEYDTYIFEQNFYKIENIFYSNQSTNILKKVTQLFEKYLEKYISKEAKVSILYKSSNEINLKTHTIKPYSIDFDTMYNDDFYKINLLIKKELTNKHKGIVLLHGIAGSGKTNYIKWLTSQISNKKFIFIPTSMISSLADPSFIGLLADNPNSILVLEDCENYISERSSTNMNTDVVSSILNIADGILSDIIECQMICTFNTDISNIDQALLRKGRLIAEYKFKELTVEKSKAYLKSIHKDENLINVPISLAELTNLDINTPKAQKKSQIGFSLK